MPSYDEKEQELIFSAEESAKEVCPVCGSGDLDYGTSESFDDSIVYPWTCGQCGTHGKEYGSFLFDGHNVDVTTMPVEQKTALIGPRALCMNRSLKIGDLALAAPDNGAVPCLPGRVRAIDMLGTENHTSGNSSDDVHMDFTWAYGERRRREIVEFDARLRGQQIPFDEICLDDVIIDPSCLIGIGEIGEQELRRIMESEENALRHVYKCLRKLL
jgi:hypothetical protein